MTDHESTGVMLSLQNVSAGAAEEQPNSLLRIVATRHVCLDNLLSRPLAATHLLQLCHSCLRKAHQLYYIVGSANGDAINVGSRERDK
jgi:hypothetical protein